jgi:hypothetical protein
MGSLRLRPLTGISSTLAAIAVGAAVTANTSMAAGPAAEAMTIEADRPAPAADPDPREVSTDLALRALESHVIHSSDPDALRSAFRAYFNYRHANPDAVRKPYLYYVDMGLDNRIARGYVFDMDRMALVEGPFNVSHGRGRTGSRG